MLVLILIIAFIVLFLGIFSLKRNKPLGTTLCLVAILVIVVILISFGVTLHQYNDLKGIELLMIEIIELQEKTLLKTKMEEVEDQELKFEITLFELKLLSNISSSFQFLEEIQVSLSQKGWWLWFNIDSNFFKIAPEFLPRGFLL